MGCGRYLSLGSWYVWIEQKTCFYTIIRKGIRCHWLLAYLSTVRMVKEIGSKYRIKLFAHREVKCDHVCHVNPRWESGNIDLHLIGDPQFPSGNFNSEFHPAIQYFVRCHDTNLWKFPGKEIPHLISMHDISMHCVRVEVMNVMNPIVYFREAIRDT